MAWHKTDGPRAPKPRERKRLIIDPATGEGAPIEKQPPGPGPLARRSISAGLYSLPLYAALSIEMNRRAYHAREGDPAEEASE